MLKVLTHFVFNNLSKIISLKNITTIIIFLIAIFFAFKIGNWLGEGKALISFFPFLQVHKPVIIEKPVPIIKYKDRWYSKIKWQEARVETVYTVVYKKWLDDTWLIYSLEKQKDKIKIQYTKNKIVKKKIVSGVPRDFIIFGTEKEIKINYNRFRFDWFFWDGLRVGCRYGFKQEIIPYVSAGFNVARLRISGEINKEDFRADISFRIF